MTYCVGILVRDGLVFVADTRTNAGLDNVATFRKLTLYETPGERVIGLATAGNLAAGQAVVSLLGEGLGPEASGEPETLWTTPSMFSAAQLVGRAVREVYRIDGPSLEQQSGGFDVTILVGGQVAGGEVRLFMIYAAGNFIEATEDTPYFQIGEVKYGKPVIDRVITPDTELLEAAKCALISFDSTMRSNISVGPPIDLVIARRDEQKVSMRKRLEEHDPYFQKLRRYWGRGLQRTFRGAPGPDWEV